MNPRPPHPTRRLATCAADIVETALELAALGWVPATSGNFSMRMDEDRVAITASGRHKGRITAADIIAVDREGEPAEGPHRPSAETALHLQIYRCFPAAGAVLHTHSRTQSVASRLFAGEGLVRLQGWELQKAVTGFHSHLDVLELPVFPNTQHMPELVARVDAWLDAGKPLHGYLIEGHGMYAWGRDMDEARRHLEALDFLLACELDLRRLNP